MKLFVSYSRRDSASAAAVCTDLRQAQHDVWIDQELQGGQEWWDEILEQIAGCGAFLFLVSPDSAKSRACAVELGYAVETGRKIIPVMVEDVNVDLAPDPIGDLQIVDYSNGSKESAIRLIAAIAQVGEPPPQVSPLPPRPGPPITDLGPLRDQVKAESLSFDEQQRIIAELVSRQDETDQHETLFGLVELMRNRKDRHETLMPALDELRKAIPHGEDGVDVRARQRRGPRSKETERWLKALVRHIRGEKFTPILGLGCVDSLIGVRSRSWTRAWAREIDFPLAEHEQDDLPHVAQWLATVTNTPADVRASLEEVLVDRLSAEFPELERGLGLQATMGAAWEQSLVGNDEDTHMILASQECPIYVVAQPWDLMARALEKVGKSPVVKLCPWRAELRDSTGSLSNFDDVLEPSVDKPLVFHPFGVLEFPESLVLTEDDFLDFVAAMSGPNPPIPTSVQRVLTDSALMLLGFGLEDLDIRVLLRTMIGEGADNLKNYQHVAAQIDLDPMIASPDDAKEYLKRYFRRHPPLIDIYWGTVEDFTSDLVELKSAVT